MPSFNKVILAGNLCGDPEVRYTPKGTPVSRVSIAVNRSWKGEDGQTREEVTFVNCDAWGRTGEAMAQYLRKGSGVIIEGRLREEKWEKDGVKHRQLKVVIESFSFTDKKTDGKPHPAPPPQTPIHQQDSDDDVPF